MLIQPRYERLPLKHDLSVSDLLKETEKVPDWYTLGIALGVKREELNNIQMIYQSNTKKAREEVFIKWLLVDTKASWKVLVTALFGLGYTAVAQNIQKKYIGKICIPKIDNLY